MSTNRHGIAALDFATVSDCDQLVACATHARGRTLDLLVTDVPYLVRVAVVASIGNSDHFRWVMRFQTRVLVGKFSLRIRSTGIQSLVEYRICPGVTFPWLADNPVEVLSEHLPLLVGRYVSTKVIPVRKRDKPWFDDQCRYAFCLRQEAHLRWTCAHSWVN